MNEKKIEAPSIIGLPKHGIYGDFSKTPKPCDHWFGEWLTRASENRMLIRVGNYAKVVHAGHSYRICIHCGFAEFSFDEVV